MLSGNIGWGDLLARIDCVANSADGLNFGRGKFPIAEHERINAGLPRDKGTFLRKNSFTCHVQTTHARGSFVFLQTICFKLFFLPQGGGGHFIYLKCFPQWSQLCPALPLGQHRQGFQSFSPVSATRSTKTMTLPGRLFTFRMSGARRLHWLSVIFCRLTPGSHHLQTPNRDVLYPAQQCGC